MLANARGKATVEATMVPQTGQGHNPSKPRATTLREYVETVYGPDVEDEVTKPDHDPSHCVLCRMGMKA